MVAIVCVTSRRSSHNYRKLLAAMRALSHKLPGVYAAAPPNVVLLRSERAWNNPWICAAITRRLARVLEAYVGQYQPVLILDAAHLHCTPFVLRAWA